MYQLKFDLLKERAVRSFNQRLQIFNIHDHNTPAFLALVEMVDLASAGEKLKHPFKTIEEWRVYGEKLILDWDVRCAKKLIDLFSDIIPKKYQNQTPIADYNESGDWALFFK